MARHAATASPATSANPCRSTRTKRRRRRLRSEAAGMLAGWSREEPAIAEMLSVVQRCGGHLGQVDAR